MRRTAAALSLVAAVACGDDIGDRSFPEGGYSALSQTGLYSDISTGEIAPDSRYYEVAHVLWSDGADKRRWLYLPPGSQIDSSNMDAWQLPVGAQLFKEFERDGVVVETRLIERIDDTGVREDDFWVGAFLWMDDGSDALLVPDGAEDGLGTEHDVPSQTDCWRCHRGQPGNVLGLAAIQLAHNGNGLTLNGLVNEGRLTHPPGADIAPPGDETTSRALGYLHANCGHCHNPTGIASIDTDMDLRLAVSDQSPEATAIYQSAVGVELQYWTETQDSFDFRIVPGAPDESALHYRMTQRALGVSMPPLATEEVHPAGVETVRDWILSL